jgi:hypothetical protein
MKKQLITLLLLTSASCLTLEGRGLFTRNQRRAQRDTQRIENRKKAIEQRLVTPELRKRWQERDDARNKRQTNSNFFGRGCGRGYGFCGQCPFTS